jgi:hypothetical protein
VRQFYEKIPATFAFNDFANPDAYLEVPSDWYVAITDVVGSTKAIEEGRYKDVNAIGVASIVGVRNAVQGISIPFVFGGDGATLLVPGEDVDKVRKALCGLKVLANDAFSLELRAGLVPVSELKTAGHQLFVCRYATSEDISQAFMSGDGLKAAERWIKDPSFGATYEVADNGIKSDVDCSGFECRWEPVNSSNGLILSLIAEARGLTISDRNKSYLSLLSSLDGIIKTFSGPCPVNRNSLKLSKGISDSSQEAKIRTKMLSPIKLKLYAAYYWFSTRLGRIVLSTGISAFGFSERYVKEIVANTDYRKFDEALRMVIDVPSHQMGKILSILEQFRRNNELFYGTHSATSALMTCVVTNRKGDHIHFIDGADGGYALAAQQLKTQRSMVKMSNAE